MRIEKGHKEDANVVDKERACEYQKGRAYITSRVDSTCTEVSPFCIAAKLIRGGLLR